MARSRVVFPPPEVPTMQSTSCSLTSRETPSTTTLSPKAIETSSRRYLGFSWLIHLLLSPCGLPYGTTTILSGSSILSLIDAERLRYVFEREPVGDHLGPAEPPLRGERDGALDVVAALAAGGVHGDVAPDDGAQVQGDRPAVEGDEEDLASPLGHAGALLGRVGRARALDREVHPGAAGELHDGLDRVALSRVDRRGPRRACGPSPGGSRGCRRGSRCSPRAARHVCTVVSPTGPGPKTATSCPTMKPPVASRP